MNRTLSREEMEQARNLINKLRPRLKKGTHKYRPKNPGTLRRATRLKELGEEIARLKAEE